MTEPKRKPTWHGWELTVMQWRDLGGHRWKNPESWFAYVWLTGGVRIEGEGPTRERAITQLRQRLNRLRKVMP